MFHRFRHTLPHGLPTLVFIDPLVHTTTADPAQAKQAAIGQARCARAIHVGELRVPVLLLSVADVNSTAIVESVAVVRTVNALVLPAIGPVIITGTVLDVWVVQTACGILIPLGEAASRKNNVISLTSKES